MYLHGYNCFTIATKREANELSPEELAVLVLNLILYVLAEFAVAFLLISINDVHDLLL
jgi:hypothetical protein